MYVDYYGLSTEPFRLGPDHKFCLSHPSFKRAHAYMQYALLRQEGFVVVTGLPGTGKTTLIGELLTDFQVSDFTLARLVSARLQGDDLLRMVCYAFDLPAVDGLSKSQLLQRLAAFVQRCFELNRRPLLIVDEAQGLSLSALEELRLLTNQQAGGQQMLQIFLVGQEELRDQLADPGLEQLRQRIVAACHIDPLKPDQTLAYVLHRLKVAGWNGRPRLMDEVFPPLYRYSRGIPRLINQICSRLLLHGSLEEKQELGLADVDLVIAELRAEHLSPEQSSGLIDLDDFDFSILHPPQPEAPPEQVPNRAQAASVADTLVQINPQQSSWHFPEQGAATDGEPHPVVESPMVEPPALPSERLLKPEPEPEALVAPLPVPISTGTALEPIWGLAASLLLVAVISAAVLTSVPGYQLDRIASARVWSDLGVTRARGLLSRWSGGNWPLAKPLDKARKPAVKRSVDEIARISSLMAAPPPTPSAGLPLVESPPVAATITEVIDHGTLTGVRRAETGPELLPAPDSAVNETFVQTVVSDVAFAFDSAEIRPQYWELLDDVASELSASRTSRAQIVGFTDATGPSDYNKDLSRRRASAVADYLRGKGSSAEQLQVEGRGASTAAPQELETTGPRMVRIYLTAGHTDTRLISYEGD
jgi:type II secretory pathway predicted ATPase ExeA/outer membrane protein OmpA-like peptidoglycan-associated protein